MCVFKGNIEQCHAHIEGAKLEEECRIADICRHDQVAMCGMDSCGEMRTFIDTCDMHEFNCDSQKVKWVLKEVAASSKIQVQWLRSAHAGATVADVWKSVL
ncbi:hypothetical protein NE865_03205 [Phthorimaea operculella]|nr:hypothetical protein NE865_03205 [Phthorimaea operculella]